MDFFTKKELKALKSTLKASEIAINADKELFKKKLEEQYGKEIENYTKTSNKTTASVQKQNSLIDKDKKNKQNNKKSFLKKLFSIF